MRIYGPRILYISISYIIITSAGVQVIQGATLIFYIPVHVKDADPF